MRSKARLVESPSSATWILGFSSTTVRLRSGEGPNTGPQCPPLWRQTAYRCGPTTNVAVAGKSPLFAIPARPHGPNRQFSLARDGPSQVACPGGGSSNFSRTRFRKLLLYFRLAPGRGLSCNPSSPSRTNRFRHFITVFGRVRHSSAVCCTATSATHPSTIRARSPPCRDSVRLRDERSNNCRSSAPHAIGLAFLCHAHYSTYYLFSSQVSNSICFVKRSSRTS